jgi:energy-coupling factor transport system permease protein
MYLRGIKPLLILTVITVAFQVFLVPGTPVFHWWLLTITDNGLTQGVLMAYRLLVIYLLAQLLTFTTSPMQLTDGLEKTLRPLAGIGVPAHELAMIMTIALRFIPVLFEESDKIVKAQLSRGANLQSGWLKGRNSLVSILVPLLNRAFQRADDLALAMEARCYTGGEGRTRLHESRMGSNDFLIMLATGGILALAFLLRA